MDNDLRALLTEWRFEAYISRFEGKHFCMNEFPMFYVILTPVDYFSVN